MFVLPVAPSLHRRAMPRPWSAFACGIAPSDERAERSPRIDVVESNDAYTVILDMPGATKDQLEISVEGQKVKVSTSPAAAPGSDEKSRVLYRERSMAAYARSVVLPAEVDNAKSQARFENGVLTLTLAKRTPAGAARISVN